MIKIEATKFYKDREELLIQDEVERELGLRRPSVEAQSLDKTTLLLKMRKDLIYRVQEARNAILNTFSFEEKNGSLLVKISDHEQKTFKANKKVFDQCVTQINAIDNAVLELDKLDCGFYGDIIKAIHTTEGKIRSLKNDLEKVQRSTRVDENKERVKELENEIKELEKDKTKRE